MEPASRQDAAILVIDDEESLRLTFQLFLQREGYGVVRTATSYDQALDMIRAQPFDLIISDIVLEGNSGIDLLRRLREEEIRCPVVMVTGYPNVETAAEAVRLGAFDYMAKPVDKETLLKVTRMALAQHRLEQEKEEAERRTREYQTLLETIFRSVTDAIITLDRELAIVTMNQAAVSLFAELFPGRNPENFAELCVGGAADSLLENARRVIWRHREISEHRIELSAKGGERRIFSVCMSPLDDGDNRVTGVVVVLRDMTAIRATRSSRRSRFHRFIGRSDIMQTVYSMIENVAKVDTTVLITGESGTGKELAAEALHEESPRKSRPLVKVDCTAIPENLLESELFGHRKGSFTGADRDRMGRILQADGGTLFLDEIGDISPMMQLRLLRFLQEKTFYPVGRDTPIQVDVRVIAATNVNLRKKVEKGEFREDLYFRLRVIDIILPALREREGDVELLARYFITRIAERIGKNITGISDQALRLMERYAWPGNVRELENVLERACVLCGSPTIAASLLPPEILHQEEQEHIRWPAERILPVGQPASPESLPHASHLSMEERIINALRKTGGNKAKAARLLGINRSTLYRKIHDLQIDLSVFDL